MRSLGGSPATRGRKRLSRRQRETAAAYLFLAPDTLGLGLFIGIPMLGALTLGFFRATGFADMDFVGLANYRRMLGDHLFWQSFRVTVVYVVGFVAGVFVASLALAHLVREHFPGVGLVRSLIFLPNVVSLVVVGVLWRFLLLDPTGAVNRVLRAIGLSGHAWLGDPATALPTVILVSIWFFMGYFMLIFLAALQDVPRDYYEAARLDGAGPWSLFRHITWPLIKPTSFFVLLLATITGVAGLQAFDLIFVMTGGGPASATSLAVFYVYQRAFLFGEFGYASAMASVWLLVLLLWSGLLFLITRGGRFEVD